MEIILRFRWHPHECRYEQAIESDGHDELSAGYLGIEGKGACVDYSMVLSRKVLTGTTAAAFEDAEKS